MKMKGNISHWVLSNDQWNIAEKRKETIIFRLFFFSSINSMKSHFDAKHKIGLYAIGCVFYSIERKKKKKLIYVFLRRNDILSLKMEENEREKNLVD